MSAEQIRLLICRDCKTIESLPDFEGPNEQDHLLSVLTKKHRSGGIEHLGMLARVDTTDWDSPRIREEIIKRLAAGADGETGLGAEFYATRDTFQEDALLCFAAHHRNPDCSDYKSDGKRLTPNTVAERKEAGMPAFHTAKDRYLCEHCPVHAVVQQKENDRRMRRGEL